MGKRKDMPRREGLLIYVNGFMLNSSEELKPLLYS